MFEKPINCHLTDFYHSNVIEGRGRAWIRLLPLDKYANTCFVC